MDDAGLAVRHPGVDDRKDARLDHFEDIDAEVRGRVCRLEPREQQAFHKVRRCREPSVETAHPDAEVDAVPCHRRDDRRAFHAVPGVKRRLRRRYRQVEEVMLVLLDEGERLLPDALVEIRLKERRHHVPKEQARRRLIAVMTFVAHMERLGDQRAQVDRA